MSVCPICKSNNYSMIIKNCHENICLTNNSYVYKYCLDCLVISQDPLPDNASLNKHYKYIESLSLKKLNSKKDLLTDKSDTYYFEYESFVCTVSFLVLFPTYGPCILLHFRFRLV